MQPSKADGEGGRERSAALGEPFSLTQAAVSKHLKVLERAGLILRGRDAQRRPARLEANGHVSRPELWECYVAGPESSPDPASWRTELSRPLVS